jgi:periplasmic protein CpxP/Spy
MFKRHVIALFAALFTTGTFAYSLPQASPSATQESAASGQHRRAHWKHDQQDPAKRVKLMTKKVNLNSDQQSKVQTILEDQQKQMEALRQDTSLSAQDRHTKVADLRQNSSSQIRALLNQDQQKKFDQMQQKREQKMAKHHGRKDQSPPQSHPKPQ